MAEVLSDITLDVNPGELFSLLGPSGCGKTTLLRLVAGLDRPSSGTVWLRGSDVTDLPAHRRPVNTVFQSYALFPHLSVYDNVAFGLRMKRVPARELGAKVGKALELAAIPGLADRKPGDLSGGEKQRVALARAVINEPAVLLLDEPLAALDLQLRMQLGSELRALQKRLGLTCIYVTHDQSEALRISDRIGVMQRGSIEQIDTPRRIYECPRTRFAAQFLGACNLLEGEVARVEPERVVMRTLFGEIHVRRAGIQDPAPGTRRTLAIRPEKIGLARLENGGLAARILSMTYTGATTEFVLGSGTCTLRAAATDRSTADWAAIGEKVEVAIRPEDVVLLAD